MEPIRLAARGQQLTLTNLPALVPGTRGLLRCVITFGTDWEGAKVAAGFGNTFAPVVAGEVSVPDAVAAKERFTMRLIGEMNGTRQVTNTVVVSQKGIS